MNDDYSYPTYNKGKLISKKEGGKTKKEKGVTRKKYGKYGAEITSTLKDKGVFPREYYTRLRDLERRFPGDKEAQNKASRESLEKAYNKKYKKKKKKKSK